MYSLHFYHEETVKEYSSQYYIESCNDKKRIYDVGQQNVFTYGKGMVRWW